MRMLFKSKLLAFRQCPLSDGCAVRAFLALARHGEPKMRLRLASRALGCPALASVAASMRQSRRGGQSTDAHIAIDSKTIFGASVSHMRRVRAGNERLCRDTSRIYI